MLWVIFGAVAFGAIAASLAAENVPDPRTYGRPRTIDLVRDEMNPASYAPAYEEPPSPWGRWGVARRVVVLSLALFVACVVMAYVTGHGPQDVCSYPQNGCDYATGHYAVAWQGPNIVWLLVVAPWPGAVALFTALGSWLATSRI